MNTSRERVQFNKIYLEQWLTLEFSEVVQEVFSFKLK